MDREPPYQPPGHDNEVTPEPEAVPEIDRLPGALGFVETPELQQTKLQIVEAMKTGSAEVGELVGDYFDLSDVLLSKLPDQEYTTARIGRNLVLALMRRDSGREVDYVYDLYDVLEEAINTDLSRAVDVIRPAYRAANEALG